MKISKEESISLFDLLSEKVGEPFDSYGFRKMAIFIGNDISDRFLYDKYNEAIKSESDVSFGPKKIDSILKALDFDSLTDFRQFLVRPISNVLLSCLGSWVSYVRQNSNENIVYQSPVLIYKTGQKVLFKLKGPNTTYEGLIEYTNGCLTTIFKGSSGKVFNHIYKIGNRKAPDVLQGIYSGISTGNDPIGGRTVLKRSDQPFEEIPNNALKLSNYISSEDFFLRNLSQYFEHFEGNNLRLNPIISFGPEDLKS